MHKIFIIAEPHKCEKETRREKEDPVLTCVVVRGPSKTKKHIHQYPPD